MTITRHAGDLLTLVAVLVGPLPWGLLVASASRGARPPIAAHSLLCVLLICTLLDTSIALALGMLEHLDVAGVVAAELALGVGGVIGLARGIRPHTTASSGRDAAAFRPIERMLVVTIAGIGVALLVQLARTPITDYDSLLYHLTAVAEYHQNRSFVDLAPAGGGFGFIGRYPFGWEALSTLFVLPFGEDFLVSLPNLIAWTVLGVSTYLLSLAFGARRLAALTAVVLLLSVPAISQLVLTLHVDIALGAFFVAALYFLTVVARSRTLVDLALFLAAIGLVFGVKTSGVVYGGLLLAIACVGCISSALPVRPERRPQSRTERGAVLLVAATALWVAGFWYVKNFIEVGNPLGSVEVRIADMLVFPGTFARDDIARTTLFSRFEFLNGAHWGILARVARTDLCLPFAALVALAACCWPHRSDPPDGALARARVGIGVMVIATLVLYWLTPFSATTANRDRLTPWMGQALRYAVPFMGMLAVGAALGATTLARAPRAVAVVAALVAIRAASAWNAHVFAAVIAAAWATGRLVQRLGARGDRRAPVVAGAFSCMVLMALFGGSLRLRNVRGEQRIRKYGSVAAFVDKRVRQSDVIGNFLDRQPYLLYGRAFDRRVVWVPLASDGLDAWIAELRQRRIKWLAVGPLNERWIRRQEELRELRWVIREEHVFVRAQGVDWTKETVFYRLEYDANRGTDSLGDTHGPTSPPACPWASTCGGPTSSRSRSPSSGRR